MVTKGTEDLNAQIEAIRADMQNLTSTVSRIAGKQMDRAQETTAEIIVTADPGCLMQMRGLANGSQQPVEHQHLPDGTRCER